MKNSFRFISLLAVTMMIANIASAQGMQISKVLCAHNKSGAITARTKCKITESVFKTQAKAWGFVRDGEVDLARSSSNVSARKIGTGLYCLKVQGASRAQVLPVITPDFSLSSCVHNFANIISTQNSGCEIDEFAIYNNCLRAGGTTEASNLAFSFILP